MKMRTLIIRTDLWFRQRPKSVTLFLSLVILGLVAALDYLTGVEVVVNFLYLIPIFLMTWRLGRTPGLLMSLLSAAVCVWLDRLDHPGISPWVAVWNVVGDFGIFALFALATARIRWDLGEERRLNAELRTALSQVKTLTGLLPVCAWCKKIRDNSGQVASLRGIFGDARRSRCHPRHLP